MNQDKNWELTVQQKLDRLMERMSLRQFHELQIRDYAYIYGDDLVFVIIDKNGRYVGFSKSIFFLNEQYLISFCSANIVGASGDTMILKLIDETKGTFKNKYGHTILWKEL